MRFFVATKASSSSLNHRGSRTKKGRWTLVLMASGTAAPLLLTALCAQNISQVMATLEAERRILKDKNDEKKMTTGGEVHQGQGGNRQKVMTMADYALIRPEKMGRLAMCGGIPIELNSILDVDLNFGNGQDEQVGRPHLEDEELWAREIDTMWEEARAAEERSRVDFEGDDGDNARRRGLNRDYLAVVHNVAQGGGPPLFPFLICSGRATSSGIARRARIEYYLNGTNGSNVVNSKDRRDDSSTETPSRSTRPVVALYNSASRSCFMASVTAVEAQGLMSLSSSMQKEGASTGTDKEEIVAIPMTPLMKISDLGRTVDSILEQVHGTGDGEEGLDEEDDVYLGNVQRRDAKTTGDNISSKSKKLSFEVTIEVSPGLAGWEHSNGRALSVSKGIAQYAASRAFPPPSSSRGGDHLSTEEPPGDDRKLRGAEHQSVEHEDDFDEGEAHLKCHGFSASVESVYPPSQAFTVTLTARHNHLRRGESEPAVRCVLSYIAALATHPSVAGISSDGPVHPSNDVGQWIIQGGNADRTEALHDVGSLTLSFFDAGLTGAGQVVGLIDTGLDEDNCYFYDSRGLIERWVYVSNADPASGPADLGRRKVVQYHVHPGATAGDVEGGHGTHVAGALAGRRSSDGDFNEDEIGFGDGIALDAKIAFLDIGRHDGALRIYPDRRLFLPANSIGAKIHSVSWGYRSTGYNSLTAEIDRYLYEDEDALVIVAAGNAGWDKSNNTPRDSSIVMPATAKNALAVGASHSDGPDMAPGERGFEYGAYYSARGPAGTRTKPDVVAPGRRILSANALPGVEGECDDHKLRREDYLFDTSKKNGLRYSSGTSMAAPAVSGAAAQIRQYFMEGYHPLGVKGSGKIFTPSGSLLKAVIVNGAQPLAGVALPKGGVKTILPYDNFQNFGRVDLLTSLPLLGHNRIRASVYDRVPIIQGAFHKYDLVAHTCPGVPFSASLVWADEPGENLINDLDLAIVRRIDNKVYFPNGLSSRDKTNNAERVVLAGPIGRERYRVRVRGTNLNVLEIKYALVVTDCAVEE